jgi:predicted regulator of Ras-like GTPase activity (Roadblock/LC7/MglB family)
LSMDHGDTQPPREVLGKLIENLIEAESSLLSAQAVMLDTSLTDRSDYESIVEHISVALGAAQMTLAELHHKFHES